MRTISITRFSPTQLWQAIVELVRAVNRSNASPLVVANALFVLLLHLGRGVARLTKAGDSRAASESHVPPGTTPSTGRAITQGPQARGFRSIFPLRFPKLPRFRTSRSGT